MKLDIRFIAFIFLMAGWACYAEGQVSGTIRSSTGEPLPFATVHIAGTTKGTSANENGLYRIELDRKGPATLVFQYIGYATKQIPVDGKTTKLQMDVHLETSGIDLEDIVVRADAEDPAYPIIREAIKRRPSHQAKIKAYTCRAYIKGGMRLGSFPNKILGQDVRQLIDADSSGFLYLSESEAEISYQQPDKYKEVMLASRVSGQSNGFSFNRFGILDFYKNEVVVGRPLVNPIADNAMSHYTYRLIQTNYDAQMRTVYAIEVTPKRSEDPAFNGTIYILGDIYRIIQTDLIAKKSQTKIEVLDTFRVQQTFVDLEGEYWPLLQQTISFKVNILNFRIDGSFVAVTSDYQINPVFPAQFFSQEIMRIETDANLKDSTWWDERRPMPLTEDESIDYVTKDSLAEVRASKPYLDSIDRIANELKPINLLMGYTLRRSWHQRRYTIAPVSDYYNAIQGWTLGASVAFKQEWRDQPGKTLDLSVKYIYGISDKQHRYLHSGRWQGNEIDRRYISWSAGKQLMDFYRDNNFSTLYDAVLLTFFKDGVKRYFDLNHVTLKGGVHITPEWRVHGGIAIEQRSPLINTDDFSFIRQEIPHRPNDDFGDEMPRNFDANNQVVWQFRVQWMPGIQYVSYPDRRIYIRSRFPNFNLTYRGGYAWEGARHDHHAVTFTVGKRNQIRSILGEWDWQVGGGVFVKRPVYFHDYFHFQGQEAIFYAFQGEIGQFMALPHYAYSSQKGYLQTMQEWDDNHYLLDRIPGLGKLRWTTHGFVHYLWTPEQGHFTEAGIGWSNIGYKLFRPFHVRFAWVFENDKYQGWAWRVGINPILPGRRR